MSAFENLRVNPFQSDRSKTVAFVSCKINTDLGPMYLNNMTLVNGTNGLFLSFPSRKLPKPDNNGKEYQSHYFMDRSLKEPLTQAAIDEYNKKLQEKGQGSFKQDGSYNPNAKNPYGNPNMETPYGNPPSEDDIKF